MRIGVPSASIERSSGWRGKAERRRVERRVRLDHVGRVERRRQFGGDVRAGTAPCGGSRRARSIVPSSSSASPARAPSGSRSSAPRARASRGTRPGVPVTVVVLLAPRVGPRDRQLERLVQRRVAHLARERAGCVAAGMPVIAVGPLRRAVARRARAAAGTTASTGVPSAQRVAAVERADRRPRRCVGHARRSRRRDPTTACCAGTRRVAPRARRGSRANRPVALAVVQVDELRRRWCSARGTRGRTRSLRDQLVRAAPAAARRRCPGGSGSTRRRSPSSRCAPD